MINEPSSTCDCGCCGHHDTRDWSRAGTDRQFVFTERLTDYHCESSIVILLHVTCWLINELTCIALFQR